MEFSLHMTTIYYVNEVCSFCNENFTFSDQTTLNHRGWGYVYIYTPSDL